MDVSTVAREAKVGSRLSLTLPFEVRQVGDPSERTLRFTASNEMVDRYRTIIKANGWKLDNWLANPVIQYGHDSSQPPVAQGVRAVTETYTRADGKTDQRLAIDVRFIPREVYPFADMLYQMALRGDIRASSVGFDVLEKRDPTEDEIKQHGLSEKSGVVVFARNELYELSIVNIPGNPLALIDTLSSYLPEVRTAKAEDVTEAWIAEKFEAVRRNLAGTVRANEPEWTKDLDQPITERRLRAVLSEFFTRGEQRMTDCLRGTAKRTEVINLQLALEDISRKVDGKRAATPPAPAPARAKINDEPYDSVLRLQLTEITKNLKGE